MAISLFLPPPILPNLPHSQHPSQSLYLTMSTTPKPPPQTSQKPRRTRSPLSETWRQKISASMRGRRLSPTHRQKLSEKFVGSGNPMYGRRLSEDTKNKISRGVRRAVMERKGGVGGVGRVFVGPKRPRGKPRVWKGSGWGYGSLEEGVEGKRRVRRKEGVKVGKVDGRTGKREKVVWEGILEEVREGLRPPMKVVKARKKQRRVSESVVKEEVEEVRKEEMRKEEVKEVAVVEKVECEKCSGTGLVRCGICGGGGIAGLGCEKCEGDGVVVCDCCGGSG